MSVPSGRITTLFLLFLLAAATPLAAHGFHGDGPAGLPHFALHALALGAIGALVTLSAETALGRGIGPRRVRTAGGALLALAFLIPFLG